MSTFVITTNDQEQEPEAVVQHRARITQQVAKAVAKRDLRATMGKEQADVFRQTTKQPLRKSKTKMLRHVTKSNKIDLSHCNIFDSKIRAYVLDDKSYLTVLLKPANTKAEKKHLIEFNARVLQNLANGKNPLDGIIILVSRIRDAVAKEIQEINARQLAAATTVAAKVRAEKAESLAQEHFKFAQDAQELNTEARAQTKIDAEARAEALAEAAELRREEDLNNFFVLRGGQDDLTVGQRNLDGNQKKMMAGQTTMANGQDLLLKTVQKVRRVDHSERVKQYVRDIDLLKRQLEAAEADYADYLQEWNAETPPKLPGGSTVHVAGLCASPSGMNPNE